MAFNIIKTAAAVANKSFQKICHSQSNGLLGVTKYVSKRTGLTVTIADVDGPTISGYFCIATEAQTDDGLPHTLEHLIFMGSESYPYKGMLDLLANRCLASGTNAMTEQHYTVYTLKTAGHEGFLIMLPIYLDHIFHPNLTVAQYTTEVHHINGEGEDAGVVYCEMQEHESDMDNILYRAMVESMYPPGCGYRSDTGGRLKNLRTSTTHEKVCAYHKKYYHPKNVNVFISGSIEHQNVFDALESVENNLIKRKVLEQPFEKPWTSPIAGLIETSELQKLCPAEDETKGLILVGWRGPRAKDHYTFTAVSILLSYFTDSAVSPMRKEFVEIDDPFCSKVSAYIEEYSESVIYFKFKGALTKKQALVKPKLLDILKNLSTVENAFDMSRMKDILKQAIEKTQSLMETDPHEALASLVISDFLNGDTNDDFAIRLNEVEVYKKLLNEKESKFWTNLISHYFVDKPYVSVVGEPKASLIEEMSKLEKERIENQRKNLGAEKLKLLADNLEKAIEENEANEPDQEVLDKCIVNSTSGIKFFELKHFSNFDKSQNDNFPLDPVPFNVILDDCRTNFLNLSVHLDTSQLPDDLRSLLPLWKSVIFESPILRNGKIIPYEDVVKEYNRDLVSCSVYLGLSNAFYRIVGLNLKVDQSKYDVGINWLKEFLYSVRFNEERIRLVAQRLANSAAQQKRDGRRVAESLLTHLIYEAKSNPTLETTFYVENSMNKLLQRLNSEPKKVIDDFERLNRILTNPSRLAVHVTCNLKNLEKINAAADRRPFRSSLQNILSEEWLGQKIIPEKNFLGIMEPKYLKSSGEFGRGAIIAVGACESSYVSQTIPLNMKRTDPDYPKLKVLAQYLSMCEGPLWRLIRGQGIAYWCDVQLSIDTGLVTFEIGRSSHPVQAFEEAKSLVDNLFDADDEEIDEEDFEAAKRSLVFEIVDQEATVHDASHQSLLSHYRGVSSDYNKELVKNIWNVSVEDLPAVCKKYVSPVFDFKLATTSVVCHPSKLDDVLAGFKRLGRELNVKTLDFDEF